MRRVVVCARGSGVPDEENEAPRGSSGVTSALCAHGTAQGAVQPRPTSPVPNEHRSAEERIYVDVTYRASMNEMFALGRQRGYLGPWLCSSIRHAP
jgi:hypothetical protein